MTELMNGPASKRPSTRDLINGHVFNCSGPDADCARWGPTPFSSWTPDLHLALLFSRLAWETDRYGKPINFSLRAYPRIAVLDTHMLSRHAETQDVRVFHMKAFGDIFKDPDFDIRAEYLVYGKVHGPAFQVVCVDRIQKVAALKGSCWRRPSRGSVGEHIYRHDLTADEISRAKQVAELFGTDGDERPARTIAIMAAELARLQWDTGMPEAYPKPIGLDLTWETYDIDLVVEKVSAELEKLTQMDEFQRALVNPRQCTGRLPNVGMMVNLLKDVEARIPPLRSPTASEKRRRAANKVSKPTTLGRKPSIAKKIINRINSVRKKE